MAALSARKQTQLAKQLQSSKLTEVQAGLSTLRPLLQTTHGGHQRVNLRIKEQHPLLVAALPLIVACLLQHMQGEGTPRSSRLELLLAVLVIANIATAEVAKTLSEADTHAVVCMLADVSAWTASDLPPGQVWLTSLSNGVATCARLVKATLPWSLRTADVFFSVLVPRAETVLGKPCSEAALLAAKPVLHHVRSCALEPERLSQSLEQLIMATHWNLPHHLSISLHSLSTYVQVGELGIQGKNTDSFDAWRKRVACLLTCAELLQGACGSACMNRAYLSDQQLLTLLSAQRELWLSFGRSSDWQAVAHLMHASWLIRPGDSGLHTIHMLMIGWLPMGWLEMGGHAFMKPPMPGCSNADVLVHALVQQLPPGLSQGSSSSLHGISSEASARIAFWWWQSLIWVQLGETHMVATQAGVRALLKAGMLGRLAQSLLECFRKCLLSHMCCTHVNAFQCLLAITAWYAERFPAVRSAIAVEHLAACRAGVAQVGGLDDAAGSDACNPLKPSSLWAVLLQVQASMTQWTGDSTEDSGLGLHACSSVDGGGAGADPNPSDAAADSAPGSVDYSRLSADEFAALPAEQLRSVLVMPTLFASMCKLQQLVGPQIQVLEAAAGARSLPPATSAMPHACGTQSAPAASGQSVSLPLQQHAAQHAGSSSSSSVPASHPLVSSADQPACAHSTVAATQGFAPSAATAAVAAAAGAGLVVAVQDSSTGNGAVSGGQVLAPSAAAEPAGALTHGSGGAVQPSLSASEGTAAAAGACLQGKSEHSAVGPAACTVCGTDHWKEGGKLQLCKGCASVRYCSSTCQKQHWKHGGHRQVCKQLQAEAAVAAVAVAARQVPGYGQ